MQEIFFVFERLPLRLGDKATLPSQLGRDASIQVGVIAANAAVLFFFPPVLTDNEVLGAEDPHAQRVLCGVRRAARLSEWFHAEGRV